MWVEKVLDRERGGGTEERRKDEEKMVRVIKVCVSFGQHVRLDRWKLASVGKHHDCPHPSTTRAAGVVTWSARPTLHTAVAWCSGGWIIRALRYQTTCVFEHELTVAFVLVCVGVWMRAHL